MIQVDNRIGGCPKFILTEEPKSLMQIPDGVRKCVVFVGREKNDGSYFVGGTAFFVARPFQDIETQHFPALRIGITRAIGSTYLVTAKHIIDAIKEKGNNKIALRVNLLDGGSEWVNTDADKWLFHPTDTEVDVAVFPVKMPDQLDHIAYPIKSFVTGDKIEEFEIGIGDDVFITGLFTVHYGRNRNIPIIRTGNIAAMPEEPLKTSFGQTKLMEAYLLETRSIGGLSGSPVFVNLGITRLVKGQMVYAPGEGPVIRLLGLVHGHYDSHRDLSKEIDSDRLDEVNMGIGIVAPAHKILEVLDQPMIKETEKKLKEEWDKKNAPAMDSKFDADEGITEEEFFEAFGKVSRPIQPQSEPEKNET